MVANEPVGISYPSPGGTRATSSEASPSALHLQGGSPRSYTGCEGKDISDDYEVVSTIADALFGKVIRAKEKRTGEDVAIKVSRVWNMKNRVTVENGSRTDEDTINELHLLRYLSSMNGGLGHPNVVRLLADGHSMEEDGQQRTLWQVMEMCSEGEFYRLLERDYCQQGGMPRLMAAQYFRQVVEGLAFLHDNRVCHLDLSLENILLHRAPLQPRTLKIVDLGGARYLAPSHSPFVQYYSGKLLYMSPQMFAKRPVNGFKHDIFTLGVILFIMLTGLPPFQKASPKDRRYAMVSRGKQGLLKLLVLWRRTANIDETTLDLLSRLLRADEDMRPDVHRLLEHPFFEDTTPSAVPKLPATKLPATTLRRPAGVSTAALRSPAVVYTPSPTSTSTSSSDPASQLLHHDPSDDHVHIRNLNHHARNHSMSHAHTQLTVQLQGKPLPRSQHGQSAGTAESDDDGQPRARSASLQVPCEHRVLPGASPASPLSSP